MPPTEQEMAELYSRYAPVIFHRARSILHNEEAAHDAVHETFARVIVKWDQFRGESSPLTWMYRITTNYCLNQIRNRKSREQKRSEHKNEIAGDRVTYLRPNDEAEKIRELLADCDEDTQRIVLYIYFDDMTREQTAQMVGLSVPTVRKRLQRFLDRARKVLGSAPVRLAASLSLFVPTWTTTELLGWWT